MGVYIREKRGRLYLDVYVNGRRVWEGTGIRVPKDPADRREAYRLAEKVRFKREMQLVAGEYDLQDIVAAKQSIVEYAEKIAAKQPQKNPLPKSLKYLREYAGNISISALSEKWVSGYRDFLTEQPKLSPNSQARYFSSFRRILNQAQRENLISRNLALNVKPIKEEEAITDYLTIQEIELLTKAPLPPGVSRDIRNAFLFSCYVGLRISDLQGLSWGHIDRASKEIRMRMQKTKKFVIVPIKESAWKLIKGDGLHHSEEKVFPALTDTQGDTSRLLRRWAKVAGVEKHLSWHVARRTFGTIALRSGADLATVSRLLGHTSLAYTQRYLKVDSGSKLSAIEAMPDIDLEQPQAGEIIPMLKAEGGGER